MSSNKLHKARASKDEDDQLEAAQADEEAPGSAQAGVNVLSTAQSALAFVKSVLGAVPVCGSQLSALADVATNILNTVQEMQDARASEDELAKRTCGTLKIIALTLQNQQSADVPRLTSDLEQIQLVLKDIELYIVAQAARPWYTRMISSSSDLKTTTGLEKNLDDAQKEFFMSSLLELRVGVAHVVRGVDRNHKTMKQVKAAMETKKEEHSRKEDASKMKKQNEPSGSDPKPRFHEQKEDRRQRNPERRENQKPPEKKSPAVKDDKFKERGRDDSKGRGGGRGRSDTKGGKKGEPSTRDRDRGHGQDSRPEKKIGTVDVKREPSKGKGDQRARNEQKSKRNAQGPVKDSGDLLGDDLKRKPKKTRSADNIVEKQLDTDMLWSWPQYADNFSGPAVIPDYTSQYSQPPIIPPDTLGPYFYSQYPRHRSRARSFGNGDNQYLSIPPVPGLPYGTQNSPMHVVTSNYYEI